MNLKSSQIAFLVLETRYKTPHPSIHSAVLTRRLGQAGMREALARGWIVPDLDGFGSLAITQAANRLHEMREAMGDPAQMGTGDQVEYVDDHGHIYTAVVRNVSSDRTKAFLAFPNERPPGFQDGQEYDTRSMKVTRKVVPDTSSSSTINPETPTEPVPDAPSSAPAPAQDDTAQGNVYHGFSR